MKEVKIRSMVSFDWAMKRLLRQKANFEVLEGFLSELLRRKVIIKHIGDSETNQEEKNDKYNRVDILVEIDNKELVIIEMQFYGEDDYFKRMLYGVSKTITNYMHKGDAYDKVRKVYSINIVYFDLGKGDDYVYHGVTNFTGLHTHQELQLDKEQRAVYEKEFVGDLYPEYYILKVNNFNDVAKDTLDEWIYYLKNNKIRDDFTAQGLEQARERLAYDNLTEREKRQYQRELKDRIIRDSEMRTAFREGRDEGEAIGIEKGEAIGIEKGEAERAKLQAEKESAEAKLKAEKEQTVINSHRAGIPIPTIATITNMTVEQVIEILKRHGIILPEL
ncbi:MAG: Rpn family recombination-promoting nuclease/putative transposase [Bacteroidales bacterium]|nr:Rpn family recombination-promoting nuclease/putative transposase [Bacteroidales bacterium]